MDTEQAAALRKQFPKSAIGTLPKGGVLLDYVGHAATTDRLLAVDPSWTWEPLATDDRGLPALDSRGNLWIRLTVAGVTRIGVGDGKSAKEVIGDAIRNAAMRFGVALDLWSREELEGTAAGAAAEAEPPETVRMKRPDPDDVVLEVGEWAVTDAEAPEPITARQLKKLHTVLSEAGMGAEGDRDRALAYYAGVTGREVASSKDLTKAEAGRVIDRLETNLTEPDGTGGQP